jgi:electron transfer flavoprotein alpha subunit
MANVFVFAETRGGALRQVALELMTAARSAADASGGGEVHALVIGAPGIAQTADALGQYGADVVLKVEDAALERYSPEVAAATAAACITERGYLLALFAASVEGRDLAPRVAATLGVGMVSDVTSFELTPDTVVASHPVYTGKAIATLKLSGSPAIVSIRPGAVTVTEAARTAGIEAVDPALAPASARVVVTDVGSRTAKLDLGEAPVVITGGRGLRAAENFAIVEALADAFGNAAVGATRAVTDDGWRNPADQIGQTGRLVSPGLYIAVGVSGAVQHLAGMRTAKVIVAINKDKDAPIFKVADYGIVGDLFEVVPALTEAVAKAKSGA